jgi:hypothetical protein
MGRRHHGGGGNGPVTPTAAATSTASASVGPFTSSSNKFTVTNSGPDLVIGTTIVVAFECYPEIEQATAPYNTVAQTILSNCTNTTGWDFEYRFDGAMTLLPVGGSPGAFSTAVSPGVTVVAWTVTASGSIRYSVNGVTAAELIATGFTYSNAGATAQYIVGGINTARVAGGQPMVDGRVLYVAHKTGTAESDANLVAITGQVNATERYLPHALVSAGLGTLQSLWQAAPDWNGIAGTTTAGAGAAPTTWTVSGTIAKNTIEAEYIYNVQTSWFYDNALSITRTYQGGSGTYTLRNPFARISFTTSGTPSRMGMHVAADTLAGAAGLVCTGLLTNGVPQGAGTWINEAGLLRAADWLPGRFTAGTSFTMIDGIQSLLAANGTRRGTCIQAIRVPTSTPITLIGINPAAPTQRTIIVADSIIGAGQAAIAPTTASAAMLIRANIGGVTVDGFGYGAWKDIAADTPTIVATLIRLATMRDGTSSNRTVVALGTNDYGLNEWAAATFQTQVAAFCDAFHIAFPADSLILVTPLTRTTETANGSGSTCGDYRTALTTVQSTRSSYCSIVAGPSLMTSTYLSVDGLHPSQRGHAFLEYNLAPSLGYTSKPAWSNSGKTIDETCLTHAWLADAAYTGGGGTVAAWTSQLGGVDLAGVASPTWGATWGTGNKGCVTLNGTTQYFTANAAAAGASGLSKPWYQLHILKHASIGTKQVSSLCHSTTASQGFHNCSTVVTANNLVCTRIGDSGSSVTPSATVQAIGTGVANIIEWIYTGSTITIRLNTVVTSCNAAAQTTVTATLDRYAVGCFLGGGTAANFTAATWRAVLVNFGTLSQPPVIARELFYGWLLADAA